MAIHTCEGMHHRFVVGPGEPVVCPHCELVTLRAQVKDKDCAVAMLAAQTRVKLELLGKVMELEAQLADCRADAERLDKLQDLFIKGEEFHIVMCEGKNEDEDCEHDTHPHFEAFDWSWRSSPVRASTLRGVIDKALAEGGEHET